MIQPRANIGQWVPEIGDPTPWGTVLHARKSGAGVAGVTYIIAEKGSGYHLTPSAIKSFEAFKFDTAAPQWVSQAAAYGEKEDWNSTTTVNPQTDKEEVYA